MNKLLLALCAPLVLLSAVACDNECSFFERCNGDVLEICGDGADQVVGRRVNSYPCEGANATCVENTDDSASCVAAPATECDDAFVPTCSEEFAGFLQRCQPSLYANDNPKEKRYVQLIDCSERTSSDAAPGTEPTCLVKPDGEDSCGYP